VGLSEPNALAPYVLVRKVALLQRKRPIDGAAPSTTHRLRRINSREALWRIGDQEASRCVGLLLTSTIVDLFIPISDDPEGALRRAICRGVDIAQPEPASLGAPALRAPLGGGGAASPLPASGAGGRNPCGPWLTTRPSADQIVRSKTRSATSRQVTRCCPLNTSGSSPSLSSRPSRCSGGTSWPFCSLLSLRASRSRRPGRCGLSPSSLVPPSM